MYIHWGFEPLCGDDILDADILSVPVCGEDVEVVERFTYLCSHIPVSAGCEPEVNRCLGRAWGVMDSLDQWVWRCRYLCGRMKVRVFRSLVLPVSLYGCETWTLTRDLRWRLKLLRYQVSSENPWLSLVGLCVQRVVAERDSNEICSLQ